MSETHLEFPGVLSGFRIIRDVPHKLSIGLLTPGLYFHAPARLAPEGGRRWSPQGGALSAQAGPLIKPPVLRGVSGLGNSGSASGTWLGRWVQARDLGQVNELGSLDELNIRLLKFR